MTVRKRVYSNKELLDSTPISVYKMVLSGEIDSFPDSFWNGTNGDVRARDCLNYLLYAKLEFSERDILTKLTYSILKKYKLSGLVYCKFHNSIYETVNFLYPGKYKPWELSEVPHKFWNEETGIECFKWLIEDKLKFNDEQLKDNLSKKLIVENHLAGMLQHCFSNDVHLAFEKSYPEKTSYIKPWHFKMAPRNYWNKETSEQALEWLIDTVFLDTNTSIPKVTKNILKDNGLTGLLQKIYKGNINNLKNDFANIYINKQLNKTI